MPFPFSPRKLSIIGQTSAFKAFENVVNACIVSNGVGYWLRLQWHSFKWLGYIHWPVHLLNDLAQSHRMLTTI
jgi:hypothetical protein